MKEFLSHIHLAKPFFLLLFFFLPLFWNGLARTLGRDSMALHHLFSVGFRLGRSGMGQQRKVTPWEQEKASASLPLTFPAASRCKCASGWNSLRRKGFCHQRKIACLFLAVIPRRQKIGTSGYEERGQLSLFNPAEPTWKNFFPCS